MLLILAKYAFLIDWGSGGHNAAYVESYRNALVETGLEVETVVSASIGAQLQDEFGWETTNYNVIRVPPPFRIKPYRLKCFCHIWQIASTIKGMMNTIARRRRQKAAIAVFSSIADSDMPLLRRVLQRNLPSFFLYLHPNRSLFLIDDRPQLPDAVKAVLYSKLPLAIGLINEDLVQRLTNLTGKTCLAMPDITDTDCDPGHAMAQKILRFASGRCVVVTAGHLMPSKGTLCVAEAAMMTDPKKYCFVFAGTLPWDNYDRQQERALLRCFNTMPHVMTHFMRMPDTQSYNAVISAADVLALPYIDWPYSLNTLTKAAALRKPVIATDGGVLGQRVRTFKLGTLIAKPSPNLFSEALAQYETISQRQSLASQADWAGYAELNSLRQLREQLLTIQSSLCLYN